MKRIHMLVLKAWGSVYCLRVQALIAYRQFRYTSLPHLLNSPMWQNQSSEVQPKEVHRSPFHLNIPGLNQSFLTCFLLRILHIGVYVPSLMHPSLFVYPLIT